MGHSIRYWLICLPTILLPLLLNDLAVAQDDKATAFEDDLRKFSFVRYRNSIDETTLWGSAGSSWVLKDDPDSEMATHLNRFGWQGSKIIFKTPFCNAEADIPRPLFLNGHIDFSQPNRHGSASVRPQRMTLSTDAGASSKSLKNNCLAISEVSDFVDSKVSFQANISGLEDVVTLFIHGSDNKMSTTLRYIQDKTWTGKRSPNEHEFVALPFSYTIKYWPYININSVAEFEKLEGEWLLSGLERRSFDNRIWSMPITHRVKNEASIKDMNMVLTVAQDHLKVKLGCKIVTSNIASLKSGFIRIEKSELSDDDNCEVKENVYNRTTGRILSVIDNHRKKGTVKLDYDEQAKTLTLTRVSKVSSSSQSWIFSR